jgi:hypothetical protein
MQSQEPESGIAFDQNSFTAAESIQALLQLLHRAQIRV